MLWHVTDFCRYLPYAMLDAQQEQYFVDARAKLARELHRHIGYVFLELQQHCLAQRRC